VTSGNDTNRLRIDLHTPSGDQVEDARLHDVIADRASHPTEQCGRECIIQLRSPIKQRTTKSRGEQLRVQPDQERPGPFNALLRPEPKIQLGLDRIRRHGEAIRCRRSPQGGTWPTFLEHVEHRGPEKTAWRVQSFVGRIIQPWNLDLFAECDERGTRASEQWPEQCRLTE
jgi:hypothetical protein